MISNSPKPFPSPCSTIAPILGEKLARADLVPDTVENAVDHLGLVLGEEGVRDVDIFRDDDARRDVIARQNLVGAGAKNGAQDGIDAGEPPSFGELLVDERVDPELLAHHTPDEIAEEAGFGLAILAALDLLAEAVRLELGDDLVQVDAGHVHLVERLDRGKAGGAPCACPLGGLAAPGHGPSAGSPRRNAARAASR